MAADDYLPRHELRRQRKRLGLTQRRLAGMVGVSAATYRMWERGKTTPMVRYWPAMAEIFGVSDAEISAIVNHNDRPDLRGHEVPDSLDHRESLILAAGTFTAVDRTGVPGILQTKGYAQAMERLGPLRLTDEQVLKRVDLRMALQAVLHRQPEPLHVVAFVAETVLLERVGSAEVMVEQCDHLLEMANLANVTVRVMPADGSSLCALGGFELLTRPDRQRPHMSMVAVAGCYDYIEDPLQVGRYIALREHLEVTALTQRESLHKISEIRESYRR
jgi:transcriptional regulator with XRE-family HTH domain